MSGSAPWAINAFSAASRPSAAARCSAVMPCESRAIEVDAVRDEPFDHAQPAQPHRERERRIAGGRRRVGIGAAFEQVEREQFERAAGVVARRRRPARKRASPPAPAGDTARRSSACTAAGRGRALREQREQRVVVERRRARRDRRRARAANRCACRCSPARPAGSGISRSCAPSSRGESRPTTVCRSSKRPSRKASRSSATGARSTCVERRAGVGDRGGQRIRRDRAPRPASSAPRRRRGRRRGAARCRGARDRAPSSSRRFTSGGSARSAVLASISASRPS